MTLSCWVIRSPAKHAKSRRCTPLWFARFARHDQPFKPPVALISGGECTVTLPAGSSGRGGRCSEFLLSLAVELNGMPGVYALACDTDGIDGSENNAGAWLCPWMHRASRRARCLGSGVHSIDAIPTDSLMRPSSLIVTGPTRTNVNDYRVILIQ